MSFGRLNLRAPPETLHLLPDLPLLPLRAIATRQEEYVDAVGDQADAPSDEREYEPERPR